MGMGSKLKALFSTAPVVHGYQPKTSKQITYIGWCCNTDQKFWVHTEITNKAVMGVCPKCDDEYIVPAGTTKLITTTHHLEKQSSDFKGPPKKP